MAVLGTKLAVSLATNPAVNLADSEGGGPTGEIPEQIPGLLAWFDPASDYITKDGSNKVSSWVSREGNSYTLSQAGGPAQLTWSATAILSKPGLTGNGTTTYMDATGALAGLIDGSAAHTVVIVCDPAYSSLQALAGIGTVANEGTGAFYRVDSTNVMEQNRFVGGANTRTLGTVAVPNAPLYLMWHYDGSTASFRSNGTNDAGGANTRAPTCDLFTVAARRYSGAYATFTNGVIADIFIYDHVLTAGEITTLEGFITGKYVGI